MTAMDVNLNENLLQHLGEDLWKCPRLKVSDTVIYLDILSHTKF